MHAEAGAAEELERLLVDQMGRVRWGDPHDPASDIGPLVSVGHRDRVPGFVQRAVEEGGEVLTGGVLPPVAGA